MKVEITEEITTVRITDPEGNDRTSVDVEGETTVIIKDVGVQGAPGEGVPTGGTTGQILKKTSDEDFETAWGQQTYSEFLFDSEEAPEGNRFDDWAELMEAVSVQFGAKRITFAHSETLPAGEYNLDDVVLAGNGLAPAPGSPGALLSLSDGFKIISWRGARIENFCGLLSVSSEPIMEIDSAFTMIIDQGSVVVSMGAPFFLVTAAIPSPNGEGLRLDFRNGSFSVGSEQGFGAIIDTQSFAITVATVIAGLSSRVGAGFIKGTAANWVGIVGDPAADASCFEASNPDYFGNKGIFIISQASSIEVNPIEGLELEKETIQVALEELAARPTGGGEGVPDEAWTEHILDNRIFSTLPLASEPNFFEETICRIYWTRTGRKVEGVGLLAIGPAADWGTVDPFLPIHGIFVNANELPFKPRVYPIIPEVGTNLPNVGGFSLLNTNEGNGDPITDNSMSVGSVVTDFGGTLPFGLFTFFHAAQTTDSGISNLVFDGNRIDLVGKNILAYFSVSYECAYEEGFMDITGSLDPGFDDVAYSETLPIIVSSFAQVPLEAPVVSAGELPAGLSLSVVDDVPFLLKPELLVSGTPTEGGEFTFTVTLTANNGDTIDKELTITITSEEPPPYNPEDDAQYLGTVSGGSYNINFQNGDPSQNIGTYIASAGEILKIRTTDMIHDFGEGTINVPVGEYMIFEGGYWRYYDYE